jgi:hypothetical protein
MILRTSATDSEQAYYLSDLNRPGTEWADVIYNISGVFLVSGVVCGSGSGSLGMLS